MQYADIVDGTIVVRFVVATNVSTDAYENGDMVWLPRRGSLGRSISPLVTLFTWLQYAVLVPPHSTAKALIKCDDDAFVVVPELVSHLRLLPLEPEAHVYFGHLYWTSYDTEKHTHVASTFTPTPVAFHRWRIECSPERHNCTGPFPFATGSLQGLSLALARELASSTAAVEHVQALHAMPSLEKRATPVYEDAWLGYALVGLLPPNMSRRLTVVGMDAHSFFDSYSFEMNNFSMVVHWRSGKWAALLLARMRAAQAFAARHRCESNATLRCGMRSHALNWAAAYPAESRCKRCVAGRPWQACTVALRNTSCDLRKHKFGHAEALALGR